MNAELRQCISVSTPYSLKSLWYAVELWIAKPHLVNRRLCGTESFFSGNVEDALQYAREDFRLQELEASLCNLRSTALLKLRNLIPRTKVFHEVIEAVLVDEYNHCATFIPLASHNVHVDKTDNQNYAESQINLPRTKTPSMESAYRIAIKSLDDNEGCVIRVEVLSDEQTSSPSQDWLKQSLLPKLVGWSKNYHPEKNKTLPMKRVLRLVPVKKYAEIVKRLKLNYGQQIVREWSESTDPHKFVSEDIGIAAYLMTLWEDEQERTGCQKQSFVDLGCGNGLLVHLLSCEGYPGVGIDVRERKIWAKYGADTKLVQRTFDPSTETLSNVNWIIGNHSDELTPWIPYITARSSYTAKFFLLPCCSFDFNHKFNKPGNESEYQAYFKYLRFICSTLGFVTAEDTLRIPSTKRKCFIGCQRSYPAEEHEAKESQRVAFLNSRLQTGRPNFVVCSGHSPIRNCTTLPPSMRNSVISVIVKKLLSTDNKIPVPSTDFWNAGGLLPLRDVIRLLDEDTVSSMKNQCGGLQTFIRNNQHIFEVHNAEVKLRNYADPHKRSKKLKMAAKTKPCWFVANHPDGCPLDSNSCSYIHPD
ncbi:LOW QUALITY PROTEIN: probable tRNA (uracil-O(2)-)-methyltransferase [Paramacrobiotus metropolitanus]|uniref:LOW QUALITY PROTEIN: probable tRNA (uracil-O(2)-)-methyltransferase n=1 Tax=Paramacrobiotus metropolitanus TaxID=2943436 RepID=UPI00244633B8|nr:LOW QUALITY PROTEIN: probable tRNA (uracil-O(2)-)-methyltransferase [Paramacrobiotus metropolitanus]